MKTKYIKLIAPITVLALTSCIGGTKKPNTKTGFVKVNDLTMVSSDFNTNFAPSKGNVKLLVVPISFVGAAKDADSSKYADWTNERIQNVNSYYFGSNDSLAAYYGAASLNKLSISGMVSPIYENSTIKTSDVMDDVTFETLFDLIEDAVSWLQETEESINWREYDLNEDGCIDNIHLITNYSASNDEWGKPLWPHMSQTDRTGILDKPKANVYSISGTSFVEDAKTAIHEQGHIFGLEDYYDYTEDSYIDYVGHYDMQSGNCFDWNSFSKLSMGWVNPYVINGEADVTTVNIKAATINGDCILIPADYSTWNGSAFDEYFLLELFAPYGNNKKDWQRYSSDLGNKAGIRLYHVDARMYGSNEITSDWKVVVDDMDAQIIDSKEQIANWTYNSFGTNNSSDYMAGNCGIPQLADYTMLSVIQRGGEFTFAQENGRHILQAADLFRVGDEFDFNKYSKFLNKNAEKQDTMNNGEDFPYKFVIDYIDEDDATITFTKIKH